MKSYPETASHTYHFPQYGAGSSQNRSFPKQRRRRREQDSVAG